ncbi:MAG: hypothetical protein EOR86_04180 [Mesorhizobium sp.]|uniref:hypothetical protein n=1 Tax=Mesorhizobium sp. TaxID=1871066 RepID=UPI000FE946B1|nr:hypothetical protein [Mesorhizobium sp.]RWN01058.1 MAG: hypothetical protein EOR86_04180 [Mesorhizobium sp.]
MIEQANRPIASYIEKWANASGRSYRDIALMAGFEKADIIHMFIAGKHRVPLDCVPALARALRCDAHEFWTLALQQYFKPEILQEVQELSKRDRSANERAWIDALRSVSGHADPELTHDRRERLRQVFLD